MESTNSLAPWNKGQLVGQKPSLKPKDIRAIRIALQNAHQLRDLPGNVQPGRSTATSRPCLRADG